MVVASTGGNKEIRPLRSDRERPAGLIDEVPFIPDRNGRETFMKRPGNIELSGNHHSAGGVDIPVLSLGTPFFPR